ncbi:Uncharacterized protein TCAP_00658 [Tolypocladium capitatum]|uniref:Kinetochore protein fta4 n=1 Tax=Tolypocladium capitatum TaxID=45235 RepID=A0A2K3QPH6_9HYPO|nr:Uncharacterized protein TCAP_00658 [Tolypocladium capitatum]
MAAPTIPSLKQSFIAAQASLLAQPLSPSPAWRAANHASDAPLPARSLDDALAALNHAIQQHCRRVYAPQATRNVAEQIASAYARDAERRAAGDEGRVDGGVGRELDLAEDGAIDALPESWPSARDLDSYPMEAKRYAETVSRLAKLGEQRRDLRRRVEKLRRLKAAVEPLRAADGTRAGVQENLVARDGPVERELERMRFLLARVAGRVAQLADGAATGTHEDAKVDLDTLSTARKRSVDEFLADPCVFPS